MDASKFFENRISNVQADYDDCRATSEADKRQVVDNMRERYALNVATECAYGLGFSNKEIGLVLSLIEELDQRAA